MTKTLNFKTVPFSIVIQERKTSNNHHNAKMSIVYNHQNIDIPYDQRIVECYVNAQYDLQIDPENIASIENYYIGQIQQLLKKQPVFAQVF